MSFSDPSICRVCEGSRPLKIAQICKGIVAFLHNCLHSPTMVVSKFGYMYLSSFAVAKVPSAHRPGLEARALQPPTN